MTQATETCLSSSMRRYVELKQALGRGFAKERRVLESIEEFMTYTGAVDWTQCIFEEWCRTSAHLSPERRRARSSRSLRRQRSPTRARPRVPPWRTG